MKNRTFDRTGAFSLVELLVAVAVMTLLLVVLTQITGDVILTSRHSHQRMDTAQRARLILDALAGDLACLVNEKGPTVFVQRTADGNVELAFLTQSRAPQGPGGPSRFLAVNYRLDTGNLGRSYARVEWDATDLVQEATAAAAPGNPASTLAGGVIRFEAMAVLDDGRIVPLTPGSEWLSSTTDGWTVPGDFEAVRLHDPLGPSPDSRVRALMVAVALLDDVGYGLLADDGTAMGAALPAIQAGETPVEVWNDALVAGNLASFPRPAVVGIHFAQSTYELK